MGFGYLSFLLETLPPLNPSQHVLQGAPLLPVVFVTPCPELAPLVREGQFPLPLCLGETGIGLPK